MFILCLIQRGKEAFWLSDLMEVWSIKLTGLRNWLLTQLQLTIFLSLSYIYMFLNKIVWNYVGIGFLFFCGHWNLILVVGFFFFFFCRLRRIVLRLLQLRNPGMIRFLWLCGLLGCSNSFVNQGNHNLH